MKFDFVIVVSDLFLSCLLFYILSQWLSLCTRLPEVVLSFSFSVFSGALSFGAVFCSSGFSSSSESMISSISKSSSGCSGLDTGFKYAPGSSKCSRIARRPILSEFSFILRCPLPVNGLGWTSSGHGSMISLY